MAGVRFYAKPYKDEVQLFLSITYKPGTRLRYYTGLKVPPEYWDAERQSVKASRNFPQHTEISAYLNNLANEATKIHLRYENEKKLLTNSIFKNELDAFRGKSEYAGSQQSFFQFFERFIKERKSSPEYAKGSITVYKTALNKVHEFGDSTRRKIDFDSFDYAFFVDLTNYLFAEGFKPNYVHKITSTLKTVLKEAERREVSPYLKVKSDWLQVSKVETEAIYLTPEELDALYSLDLSNNPRLDRVRDLFLIGCHTGLRFSDYSQLNPENIIKKEGKHFIRIVTQKTAQLVTIPLKPVVREILHKYKGVPPKGLSNQKMNAYLKELGELAGITEPVTLTTFKRGERKQEVVPKCQLITTHTARRSFATNAFKANLPPKSIMQITGHKNDKEFYKYIRLNSDEHALLMADNPFFQ
ncbi:MAG: tyrosine-type recombinase/integrase [Saprospiraceae bacterium]